MEQVFFNESRIPARLLLMKPLSAAKSIGTGGPFGAEGPIVAAASALGSLVGQFAKVTAEEREILLAAGAAAGMSATSVRRLLSSLIRTHFERSALAGALAPNRRVRGVG